MCFEQDVIHFCTAGEFNGDMEIEKFCNRLLAEDGSFDTDNRAWEIFACIIIGLAAGIMIGEATEYSTSYAYTPTT